MTTQVLTGDCRDLLQQLPAKSVHTVVTSPPYYSLRDYAVAGQLGLEPTAERYVSDLCDVLDAVRRVMRDDATLWLNLGDAYGSGKQLLGMPWRVAFALQARGWCLRSDIIWAKLQPNPMPESVTDRPTRSHEFIFLLTKNSRYFYDSDSIREPLQTWREVDGEMRNVAGGQGNRRYGEDVGRPGVGALTGNMAEGERIAVNPAGRNKRDVWTVSTKPYAGAHFATFPPDLIEPCVLAGCPERACGVCGAPWERIVERTPMREVFADQMLSGGKAAQTERPGDPRRGRSMSNSNSHDTPRTPEIRTLGFEPSCACNADPTPGVVLDPFAGAGTTGIVAARNRRSFVGLELNPEYAQMARDRIETDLRIGHRNPQRVDVDPDQLGMFG
jgi:site-specific DNA-methyltransferase (adenine-specific)